MFIKDSEKTPSRLIKAGTVLMALIFAITAVPYFGVTVNAAGSHWIKKGSKKVSYVNSNGEKATGIVKIGKKVYYFNKKGKLAKSRKERMVSWNGDHYDVKKNGVIRKGWNTFGSDLYYFGGELGKRASSKKVGKITLRDNGKAVRSLDASIKYKVIKILKSKGVFNKSKKRKLRACWNWIIGHCHYSIKYPLWKKGKWHWGYSPSNSTFQKGILKHGATWVKKYANDMLGSSRGGNCYGFACAFAACAGNIGYDPYIVVARTANSGNRDGRAGVSHDGYSRHAWVRIKGRVYDPEATKVGWRYKYGAGSIGLRCKSVKKIRYKKISGSKSSNKAAGSIKSKLVKRKGIVYYYNKKGRKERPAAKVVFAQNKYYYFDKKHKSISGKKAVSGKLYDFTHKDKFGYYMTSEEYERMKALTKEGAPFEQLKNEIGEAAYEESTGCYSTDPGKERIYKYDGFSVQTFVPDNGGTEIIIGVI